MDPPSLGEDLDRLAEPPPHRRASRRFRGRSRARPAPFPPEAGSDGLSTASACAGRTRQREASAGSLAVLSQHVRAGGHDGGRALEPRFHQDDRGGSRDATGLTKATASA
jgi:hypothetical protein